MEIAEPQRQGQRPANKSLSIQNTHSRIWHNFLLAIFCHSLANFKTLLGGFFVDFWGRCFRMFAGDF